MTGGDSDEPLMPPPANGGEFLLSLLQRTDHQSQTRPRPPQSQFQATPFTPPPPQQQSLTLDPAVAAVGPSLSFTPPPWQSNARDFLSPHLLPPALPHNFSPPGFAGFPQNPRSSAPGSNFLATKRDFGDDLQGLEFSRGSVDVRPNNTVHNLIRHKQKVEQKLQFGSLTFDIRSGEGVKNLNGSQLDPQLNSNSRNFDLGGQKRGGGGGGRGGGGVGWGKGNRGGNYRSMETRMKTPPGFSNKPRGGGGNWDYEIRRRNLEHNVSKIKGNHSDFSNRSSEDERLKGSDAPLPLLLEEELHRPGLVVGSDLHSVSASNIKESLMKLHIVEDGNAINGELDDVGEELVDSLLVEGDSDAKQDDKKQNRVPREKASRSDNRGQRILSQRMRMRKRQVECRCDIVRWDASFLAIYESLIPPEEEKAKQKQLLTLLEKLVNKEWPEARLYLYGSCANSFGVSKSDIDVCLSIDDSDISKSQVLLKLADILTSDNLLNVQALTRARVPIVKLMDPATGISCDICINNALAVVNTKLLWDYAQIDVRVRQLAFIVKKWAKSRGVNETYQGTLSSYAYVLMCIHFLQQRRPAILPCLQEMEATYSVTVDDFKCAYFDQVEKLCGFGSHNKETIAQLVWAFFNYWAYRHDYKNDVISIRTGSIISKREKDWTRRIGNDRHLICIEDPFEISHDLGRVVDKYTINVLREEFERAADIMQYDANPCVTLFEPYVLS